MHLKFFCKMITEWCYQTLERECASPFPKSWFYTYIQLNYFLAAWFIRYTSRWYPPFGRKPFLQASDSHRPHSHAHSSQRADIPEQNVRWKEVAQDREEEEEEEGKGDERGGRGGKPSKVWKIALWVSCANKWTSWSLIVSYCVSKEQDQLL